MKNRLFKLLILLLLISFFIPLTAKGAVIEIENPLETNTFWGLIDSLIDFVFYLAIAIAPIMFLVAGFDFITAAGELEKINTAKKIILWALIGLLIVFLSKAFVELVGEIFGVQITPP